MATKVSPREFQRDWLCLPTRKLLAWIANGVCPAPYTLDAMARWDAAVLEKWEDDGHRRCEPPSAESLHNIRVAILAEEIANDIRFQEE